MAFGSSPSPQALSMGGLAQSTNVTAHPMLRSAIAAAKPAGPPPAMHIFCGAVRIFGCQARTGRISLLLRSFFAGSRSLP